MMKEKPQQLSRKVTSEEAGTRLDRCLRLWIPHLPQSMIEKASRKGALRIDEQKAKPAQRVIEGQIISYPESLTQLTSQVEKKVSKPLTVADKSWLQSLILYEDQDMVVLNKPAGIAVQGGTNQKKSLDALMVAYYEDTFKPRLVHRLDQETSGVLVLAKSLPMARKLTHLFKERQIQKIYWAFVCGVPQQREGVIMLALSKKQTLSGEKIRVDQKEGVKAVTFYRILESLGRKMAWLELTPQTGRMHQLRVHCAEGLGTPILGDGKYGGADAFPFGRVPLHLHARALTIPADHGKSKTFEAPLPPEFEKTLKDLGFTCD